MAKQESTFTIGAAVKLKAIKGPAFTIIGPYENPSYAWFDDKGSFHRENPGQAISTEALELIDSPSDDDPVLAVGDAVRLRSGGRAMLINRIDSIGKRATCVWFDDDNKLTLQEAIILKALVKAD